MISFPIYTRELLLRHIYDSSGGYFLLSSKGVSAVEIMYAVGQTDTLEVAFSEIIAVGAEHTVTMDVTALFLRIRNEFPATKYLTLMHNHPNGGILPSGEDILLTQTVYKFCKQNGIQLFDHFISGRGEVASAITSRVFFRDDRTGFFTANQVEPQHPYTEGYDEFDFEMHLGSPFESSSRNSLKPSQRNPALDTANKEARAKAWKNRVWWKVVLGLPPDAIPQRTILGNLRF